VWLKLLIGKKKIFLKMQNKTIIIALLFCVLGAAIIFGMELVSKKMKKA
jgi:hypothetical protein